MTLHPIAFFHSPLKSKFGIPRQSGLVSELAGQIILEPPYRQAEAIRGMEDFDYLWLIWGFSANSSELKGLTVRPPRLGGNRRMGIFATRSPFRPNPIGLSCVRLDHVEHVVPNGPVIHVRGADLMDGTPIYDIKPYVAYTDAHADARCGFVNQTDWHLLRVELPKHLAERLPDGMADTLKAVLSQDPRPRYHDDPNRVYGMPFLDFDIRFQVSEQTLTVVDILKK